MWNWLLNCSPEGSIRTQASKVSFGLPESNAGPATVTVIELPLALNIVVEFAIGWRSPLGSKAAPCCDTGRPAAHCSASVVS